MGMLVNGKWENSRQDAERRQGRFVRPDSAFRGQVSADGGSKFPAASGRYHLYVSLACPWAHRTLIVRKLKRLEQVISVSVVHPHMGENGWRFDTYPGSTPDQVNNCLYLHQLYSLARPDYTGRVTVPVLWDKESATLVNNESADIIRMLNSEFDAWGDPSLDLYPRGLRAEIDEINRYVYDRINNGVYKAGFATTQDAHGEAVEQLFEALDTLESRLSGQSYLVGDRMTEADCRLFTTLVRFDAAYHGHFKCNIRRLTDYTALWSYARRLYGVPGIADTVNLDHIKRHYYTSHPQINPTGIIPVGPLIDFSAP